MTVQTHLPLVLSPRLEQELYSSPTLLYEFFDAAHETLQDLKHCAVLVVPGKIGTQMLQFPKSRILFDLIRSHDAGIEFVSPSVDDCCVAGRGVTEVFPDIEYDFDSAHVVIDFLKNGKFPLLADAHLRTLNKTACPVAFADFRCQIECNFEACLLDAPTSVRDAVSVYYERIIHHLRDQSAIYSSDGIRFLMALAALLFRLPDKVLKLIRSLKISETFVSDIGSEDLQSLFVIAYSLLRAASFPAIKSPGATEFSIDWHPHMLRAWKGYSIYRVDIVSSNTTGRRGLASGAKRALMVRKSRITWFMSFTSVHEFNDQVTKVRIEHLTEDQN